MAATRRSQSNAMMYTVLTFVGLFIIATTVAVIYYVKAEDYRTRAQDYQSQLDEMASRGERDRLGALVGAKDRRQSWLGAALEQLDRVVSICVGGVPPQTSAEVKAELSARRAGKAIGSLDSMGIPIASEDPNEAGLVRTVERITRRLQDAQTRQADLEEKFARLQRRFDDTVAAASDRQTALEEEKAKYQEQATQIQANYDELKQLMEKTTEEQVQTLMARLNRQKSDNQELNRQMLKTEAQLRLTQERMERLQHDIAKVNPPPDNELTARKPDAKVILVDSSAGVVHLDIGRREGVYQGLRFSVYDRNVPIPRDGRGKAEVEVFSVGENFSGARVLRSETRNPIAVDDIAANLIWDSARSNIFVVAGDFDLNEDGSPELDGEARLKSLVEKWGGKVVEKVSSTTDFLVLGAPPRLLPKPTFDELAIDPMAMEKYNSSIERRDYYKKVQELADVLSIPVFNTERFLHFIGYGSRAGGL
jgi:predicted  nucleic acid-binding Zn-ribbon protein